MSKIHNLLATTALRDSNVLENPGSYLGDNAEEVLRFWREIEFLDNKTLDEIQLKVEKFTEEMKSENYSHAYYKSRKVMGEMGFNAVWWAVDHFIGQRSNSWVFCVATLEIIGGVKNKVLYSLIMPHSKIYKEFSEILNEPKVFTEPEKYLGPNYQNVFKFWIYVDTLSDQDNNKIYTSYRDLDYDVRWSDRFAAKDAAQSVIDWEIWDAVWRATYNVTKRVAFSYATDELIANLDNKVVYNMIMSHKRS
jgi:hypothetical protein